MDGGMRMPRGLMAAALAALAAGPANGQFVPFVQPNPYAPPGARQPALSRQNNPLPPYLNLFQGGIPAVNYFSQVRPLQQLQRPAFGTGLGLLPPPPQQGGGLFPAAEPPAALAPPVSEPAEGSEPGRKTSIKALPPTGHGASFDNRLGYYPQAAQPRLGGGSQQPQGSRFNASPARRGRRGG